MRWFWLQPNHFHFVCCRAGFVRARVCVCASVKCSYKRKTPATHKSTQKRECAVSAIFRAPFAVLSSFLAASVLFLSYLVCVHVTGVAVCFTNIEVSKGASDCWRRQPQPRQWRYGFWMCPWVNRQRVLFFFGLKRWNDTCGIPSTALLKFLLSSRFPCLSVLHVIHSECVCLCLCVHVYWNRLKKKKRQLDFDITTGTQYQIEIETRLEGCRLCVCAWMFVWKTWAFLQFIKNTRWFLFLIVSCSMKGKHYISVGLITGLWIIIILYAMPAHTHTHTHT